MCPKTGAQAAFVSLFALAGSGALASLLALAGCSSQTTGVVATSGSTTGSSGATSSGGVAGSSGVTSGGASGTSAGGPSGVPSTSSSGAGPSSGTSPSGESGESSGAATSGAESDGGSSGASVSDAATSATDGDTPAWRAIDTDTAGFRQLQFTARQVDPTVSDPNSHPDDMERASVDTSKPLKKKLCVVLTGIGTGPGQGIGDWAGHQGYHVFQVGYSNAIAMAANGDTNPDTPGNTRMNQFDGMGRTPSNAQTLPQDSIQGRTVKAIQYLAKNDPGGDWGWFLNEDGTMRWSDGCFIGYSYGATHLAVISRYVRLGLGVSTSGPQSEGFPDATWIQTPSATPIDRMFAIYGEEDGPQKYDDATMALGYIGDVLMTTTTADPGTPPYAGTHRIEVEGQGHTEFCAGMPPQYCYYMFGLSPFPAIP